ncbi:hypothetical protein KLP28_16520 [Nocardioidaceae bacterium]|nr:hypothetical protein KLP28_16520 [Nocardioidaceae bacterium]
MTRRHRPSRAAVLVAGLGLALLATSVPARADRGGAPADPGGAAGSTPLPGYEVVLPDLEPVTVDGEESRVTTGVRANAGYAIEKPARWNGELVMWAHGYRGTGTTLTVDPPGFGLRERLLEQGYAWAASSYARNGYDVGTGVTTTHDLARFARSVLGAPPSRTYVAGVSMGGHVIGRSLEEYPNFYDGALPMCGVLGDVELFDFFLSFNLAAQELADVDAYPFPADYYPTVSSGIQTELGLSAVTPNTPFAPVTDPRGAQLRAATTELSGGERPGALVGFAAFQDFLFTLGQADDGGSLALNPGRVAQNLDTTYAPNRPVDLQDGIERVAPADPAARTTRRLDAVPVIDGRPKVPTLTLHGLGDLFVPFSMEQAYAEDVADNGQQDLVVQRAIRSVEHCEFTPTEVGTAWDDLTTWVESLDNRRARGPVGTRGGPRGRAETPRGRTVARPAGDVVLDPAVVAERTYGCTFTDPTSQRSSRLALQAVSGPCPAGSSVYDD